jgi:extradiol dioxygenase family protein
MKISEIAFVAYPVIDIERSRGFYEGVLGLQPSREFSGESYAWIEYDLGANTFAVAMATRSQSINDIHRCSNISHVYSGQ